MTSTVIKPTVGRKVWYRPFGHNRTQLGVWDDDQPCDATVTYAWHDRMVNLHVVGPAGAVHQFNSVQLLQAGDPVPAGIEHGGYAEWMPYQQGQARKDAASTIPPHQQRVIDEKAARDGEIDRLAAFVASNPVFATLPQDEQARLRRQLDVMRELSVILGERIAAF